MTLCITQGPLAHLRDRPISGPLPNQEGLRIGYRTHPVDLDDPRGADPMVDVRDHGIAGENYYYTQSNPPYFERIAGSVPDLRLRAPLVKKLAGVNDLLRPYGLHLWVFDAWRPIAVQNHFHDHWMPNHLKRLHPDMTGDALAAEVEKYWARGAKDGVIDPLSPPPHATGSAIDLTLRYVDGRDLFMGSIFDDVTKVSNTTYFEDRDLGMGFSDIEARNNRRLLFWLMHEAGFVNNPTEWWHFSCGDQMWARLSGARAAYYSTAPTP